jgi:hypothetical protein
MKILTALLLLVPLSINAADKCEDYSKKIDRLKDKMRQGYTVKQGEKLKKRLTKLQDERFDCERGFLNPKKSKKFKKRFKKKWSEKEKTVKITPATFSQ